MFQIFAENIIFHPFRNLQITLLHQIILIPVHLILSHEPNIFEKKIINFENKYYRFLQLYICLIYDKQNKFLKICFIF